MEKIQMYGWMTVARVIAEEHEYSRLRPEHIEAIAKARAKEGKLSFMKEVEDRERSASGGSVKRCPHCGATVPMQASLCGECGGKLG